MQRSSLARLAVLLVAAIAMGACGSAKPDLTDPAQIVTKSVESLQQAKSVHFEATIEGTVVGDLMGTGQGGQISLVGTTLRGDVDATGKNVHVSAAVPALLGLTADIVVIGPDTWTRISVLGPKYKKSATTATAGPADPAAVIDTLKEWLAKPEVSPTKKDDATCGSKKCYQIEIDLSASDLQSLVAGQDLGDASAALTILVEKDTLHPAVATVHVTGAKVGDLTFTLTLSDWDKPVSITAPAADQVE